VTSYSLARPVPGNRIVPYGQERTPSDVLPNGHPAFRITQRFDDVNPAFPNLGAHRATDLGNWWCGDQVYAVYGGLAKTIGPDQYGALGIIIDHGAFQSVYWHLNAFTIPRGDAVPVKWGQQIGIVGKTGLGAVCHLHFEIKVNGTRIDPESYLLGAPLVLEDDMNIPAGKHIAQGVVGTRNRLRRDPDTIEGSRVLDTTIFVQVYQLGVKGAPYTLGGVSGDDYAWVGAYGETWYVAQPLVTNIALTPIGSAAIPPNTVEVIKEVPTGITRVQYDALKQTAASLLEQHAAGLTAAAAKVRETNP
jgi:hypothetical protein